MAKKTANIEINGKKFKITELDSLRARDAILLLQDQENKVENRRKVLKFLLANVEMDFGDGRTAALDTEEIINQNLSLPELLKLEEEANKLTFGFLLGGGI